MSVLSQFQQRLFPSRSIIVLGAVVLVIEILTVIGFVLVTQSNTRVLTLVYPFIWINVGLWAVATTTPGPADDRHRLIAQVIGGGYFAVLAVAGGILWISPVLSDPSVPTSFRVVLASVPPGWGPALVYVGEYFSVTLIPFKLIGYIALSYLVYTTVIDAAGSVVTGMVGLFSCVSCVWPIAGTVLTSVFGSGSAIASIATNQPYGVSTVVFVSAVALLYWRPLR